MQQDFGVLGDPFGVAPGDDPALVGLKPVGKVVSRHEAIRHFGQGHVAAHVQGAVPGKGMVRTEVASDLLTRRIDEGGYGRPVTRIGGEGVDLFKQILRTTVLKRIGQISGHAFYVVAQSAGQFVRQEHVCYCPGQHGRPGKYARDHEGKPHRPGQAAPRGHG